MRMNLWKRYGMFISGVVVSALGISLITKAGLGTSPITSLAYVLTFLFPYSLGTFTMIVNTIMFLIQMILRGKDFERIQFLQVPSALIFSVFIDAWLHLFYGWEINSYLGQILMLLSGCGFLGLGIALEVMPNVLTLPGEGLVRTIAGLTGWRFGHVKTGFDLGMVTAAAVVSFCAAGTILGIREGTVMAALLVGNISHFFIGKVSGLLGDWMPQYSEAGDAC